MKHLANLLTMLNLFAGCIAVVFLFKERYDVAGAMVCASLVFDFFDGFVARLTGSNGELGKQLDSLADMVSFGLVPGLVLFNLYGKAAWLLNQGADSWMNVGQYAMFLVTVFSALRLGKFNIDPRQSSWFIGLPTPANTLFIMSLPFILEADTIGIGRYLLNPFVLFGLACLSSWIMVAEIPLIALKISAKKPSAYKGQMILLLAAIILILRLHLMAIPFILVLYILISLIYPPHKNTIS